MPRMDDWQRDVYEGLRRENWSLRGPNCVVKVLPLGVPANALGGYITVGRSLLGKTPLQIQEALGLKPHYLDDGARIYRFARLPMLHEYEYQLTAKYPGGQAYNPAHSDPNYQPGSDAINQWAIKEGVSVPVDARHFLDLHPSQKFPYDWLVA
jgi:hypothetical protein